MPSAAAPLSFESIQFHETSVLPVTRPELGTFFVDPVFLGSIIGPMAWSEQDKQPYILYVRSPAHTKVIGVFLLAAVASPIVYLSSKVGLGWIASSVLPAIFLLAIWGAGIMFALWLIFPPQSTLARFEFTSDRVRFIPNLMARGIGEQSEETAISSQSAEILICRCSAPEKVYGYRIIVIAIDGTESELGSHSPHTQVVLNPTEIDRMAKAIPLATQLPVRVLRRRTLATGTVEEMSGMPPASKTNALMGIGAAVAVLPYVAGIFVGWLFPGPAIVIAVGLVLWCCIVLTLYVAGRTGARGKNFPALRTLTTLVTFSTTYGVSFVLTAYFCGRLR